MGVGRVAGFRRLGASHDADEAANLLRELGIPGRAGGRSSEPLTPREAEVFDLLAHGLTNREIAERLYISPKTAEHHVSRILDKLNLRSRLPKPQPTRASFGRSQYLSQKMNWRSKNLAVQFSDG